MNNFKKNIFQFLFLLSFLVTSKSYAQVYNLPSETYTTSTVWSDTALNYLNYKPWNTQVTYYNGNTYIVYVAGTSSAPRAKIAKITSTGATETFLDLPDYNVKTDAHHQFSIGVDEKGYLHITGDMHNYPNANTSHMPIRYQNGTMMYWKSDNPEDITGFTWLGDSLGGCPAGFGNSYYSFFNDHHGRLFSTGRNWSRMGSGQGKKDCASLSRYDASSGIWTDMGGTPNSAYPLPTVFWENNSEGGTSSYARVRANGIADLSNRIHMVTTLLNTSAVPPSGHINTDFVYIQSDDNAQSFTKADGSPIQLPARVEAGVNQGDVLLTHNYLSTDCSIAFDRNQNPVGLVKAKGVASCSVFSYDSATSWTNHGWTNTANESEKIHSDAMGVLTIPIKGQAKLIRFWDWNTTTNHFVTIPWSFKDVDKMYLQKTGNIQGIFHSGSNITLGRVLITRPQEPEIVLEGNAQNIPNNSSTPLTSNNTDFGGAVVGDSITNTFIIKNIGNTELRVFNVTVNGTDFSVVIQPNDSIAPSSQTTFQIKFKPTSTGTFSDTVSFGCSDLDESRFYFTIKGSTLTNSIININNQTEIHVYPNPVSNILNIDSKNSKIKLAEVYNVNGQLLRTYKSSPINFTNFNSGSYFVLIHLQSNEIIHYKVIKHE